MISKIVMNYMDQRPFPADAPRKRWLLSYIVGLSGGLIIGYILLFGMTIIFLDCFDLFPSCLYGGHKAPTELAILGTIAGFFGGICSAIIRQLFIIFPRIFVQSILYGILGILLWPIFASLVFVITVVIYIQGDTISIRDVPTLFIFIIMVFVSTIIGMAWAAIHYAMMKQKWASRLKQHFML